MDKGAWVSSPPKSTMTGILPANLPAVTALSTGVHSAFSKCATLNPTISFLFCLATCAAILGSISLASCSYAPPRIPSPTIFKNDKTLV